MVNGTITAADATASFLTVLTVLGVVSFVFLSALGIVWCLKKIGGKLSADVKGTIRKAGAVLMLSGTGLLGCYLAVVITEFAGIYFVTMLMR